MNFILMLRIQQSNVSIKNTMIQMMQKLYKKYIQPLVGQTTIKHTFGIYFLTPTGH